MKTYKALIMKQHGAGTCTVRSKIDRWNRKSRNQP